MDAARIPFLGRGWAFPLRVGADGGPAMVSDEEDVRQSIRIILGTNAGERHMRPDFGADLRALVFSPIGAATASLVQERVHEALVRFEPRIDVLGVDVTAPDEGRAGRLSIEIRYRIRATNTFYNLVYPFYLLEGEPA